MSKRQKRLAIVIPAYNEEIVISETLKSVPKRFVDIDEVVIAVIDDGSVDSTFEQVSSNHPDVFIVRHVINRGLGGALTTGLRWSQQWGADFAVTFDADGQHDPLDIERVLKPLLTSDADIVIGSRLLDPKGMPWYRVIGNWGLNIITYALFGVWTTDSQSGLRAFSAKALRLIKLNSSRMEVSSEIISEIGRNKLRLREIPISCIYTAYSLSKGQKNSNGINIVLNLFYRKVSRI